MISCGSSCCWARSDFGTNFLGDSWAMAVRSSSASDTVGERNVTSKISATPARRQMAASMPIVLNLKG